MADTRTISQLEADGYPWVGCECCKGTVWVPFKMIREKLPLLSAMTLDEVGARLRCDGCGKRPERYCPAWQSEAPGFARRATRVGHAVSWLDVRLSLIAGSFRFKHQAIGDPRHHAGTLSAADKSISD